ncbi:hypothetical protein CDAR_510771 [Caerostris darwini]|uniref:Secreted protein n=1 Tax=Caerostris darwini TaxID=1538125 RepID=A0AAV4T7S3_9ARAC|nr:hypothetical protein CDAR_510771 [Caerostris darwini]
MICVDVFSSLIRFQQGLFALILMREHLHNVRIFCPISHATQTIVGSYENQSKEHANVFFCSVRNLLAKEEHHAPPFGNADEKELCSK